MLQRRFLPQNQPRVNGRGIQSPWRPSASLAFDYPWFVSFCNGWISHCWGASAIFSAAFLTLAACWHSSDHHGTGGWRYLPLLLETDISATRCIHDVKLPTASWTHTCTSCHLFIPFPQSLFTSSKSTEMSLPWHGTGCFGTAEWVAQDVLQVKGLRKGGQARTYLAVWKAYGCDTTLCLWESDFLLIPNYQ